MDIADVEVYGLPKASQLYQVAKLAVLNVIDSAYNYAVVWMWWM